MRNRDLKKLEASRKLLKQKPWMKPFVEPYWSDINKFLTTLETRSLDDVSTSEWEMFETSFQRFEEIIKRTKQWLLLFGAVSLLIFGSLSGGLLYFFTYLS